MSKICGMSPTNWELMVVATRWHQQVVVVRMDHQGASTCTWVIFIFGMHSINIRRVFGWGVTRGHLHDNANTLAVNTMPSSTGKLSTETLVQRNTEALVQRRNPPHLLPFA